MNSVIEAINNRRSTRCFEPKPIPKDVLNMIVEAGNQAPYTSMTRSQPWRFVVVQDQTFKQKLLQTTLPIWKQSIEGMKAISSELYEMAMSLYNAMEEPKDVVYYNAPAIVFVVGPADNAVSCSLACENIMIAAESLGLGSCYVGFGAMVKGNADVVQALELKEDEAIYGPILLGYPKVNPTAEVADALEKIGPNKKDAQIKWV